jgi:hypothetical protein
VHHYNKNEEEFLNKTQLYFEPAKALVYLACNSKIYLELSELAQIFQQLQEL